MEDGEFRTGLCHRSLVFRGRGDCQSDTGGGVRSEAGVQYRSRCRLRGITNCRTCGGANTQYGLTAVRLGAWMIGAGGAQGAHFHLHGPVGASFNAEGIAPKLTCGRGTAAKSQWNRPMYGVSGNWFATGDIALSNYYCPGAPHRHRAFARIYIGSMRVLGALPGGGT